MHQTSEVALSTASVNERPVCLANSQRALPTDRLHVLGAARTTAPTASEDEQRHAPAALTLRICGLPQFSRRDTLWTARWLVWFWARYVVDCQVSRNSLAPNPRLQVVTWQNLVGARRAARVDCRAARREALCRREGLGMRQTRTKHSEDEPDTQSACPTYTCSHGTKGTISYYRREMRHTSNTLSN